jgi:ubiquinone/menaquinone biosynthesis C-methylase UbiE
MNIYEDKLHGDSLVYKEQSDVYDKFSETEDSARYVEGFLKSVSKNKDVLDFGCGTGKYIPLIVPVVKSYIATDISDEQLNFARQKSVSLKNVKIIRTEKDKLPIDSESVDVVFATWVVGSILDLSTREKVLSEIIRILRPGGQIYLIENDKGGEFKDYIEGDSGDNKTQIKMEWLNNFGFEIIKSFTTRFEFKSAEEAKDIFNKIWGKKVSEKIVNKKIGHNVVIYKYEK